VGIFANALNVLLCYALVLGRLGAPALGAQGSVLANGISFSAGALVLLALWWRGGLVLPSRVGGRSLTAAISWRLLRIGLPTAAEQAAFQLGLLFFLSIIALYGTPPV